MYYYLNADTVSLPWRADYTDPEVLQQSSVSVSQTAERKDER